MAWVRALLGKLQKGCTRLTAASDKVYQLLAHGQWFSQGSSVTSTIKTGHYDIAENGVKHQKSINQYHCLSTNLYTEIVYSFQYMFNFL
jgi:hypothetical protein